MTEVITILSSQAGWTLKPGGHQRVQLTGNVSINDREVSWFDQFVSALSIESGRGKAEVIAAIARWASLTDALKYVQLGSPENVVILKNFEAQ